MDEITITEGHPAPSHTDATRERVSTRERVPGGDPATADAGTDGAARAATLASEERDTLRRTLAAAHPDAIPELIDGATVGEMIASLTTAKAVYARTIERAGTRIPVSTGAPGRATTVDVARLSPLAKIAYALKEE